MKIRLPLPVKRQIEAAARASNRTLNGEIVQRLEQTFAEDDRISEMRSKTAVYNLLDMSPAIQERFDRLEARMAELEKQVQEE